MVQSVRKLVHTEGVWPLVVTLDGEVAHAPLGYNNHSGRRPRRRAHPDIDCSRIQRTESREVEVGRKQHSIDLRDNDRGVTSFEACGHGGVEYHLAIVEALSRALIEGVPWFQGKCGKGTSGQNGEQEILMVGWSEVGV